MKNRDKVFGKPIVLHNQGSKSDASALSVPWISTPRIKNPYYSMAEGIPRNTKLTSLEWIERIRAASEHAIRDTYRLGRSYLHEIAGRTLEENSKCLGICNSESKPATKEERKCLGIATREMLK